MKLEDFKAWHGTEHKFDAFSMDKVGTGEGAQMYGYGVYLAQNKDVAKTYSPRNREYEEELLRRYNIASRRGAYVSAEVYELAMLHEDPEDIKKRLTVGNGYEEDFVEEVNNVVDQDLQPLYDDVFHGVYEVRVIADMDELLDWEAPISKQSETVRDLLKKVSLHYDKDITGEQLYSKVGNSSKEAAYILRRAGIIGIKYQDAGSRDGNKSTYNFVIFSDGDITILKQS
jgi:hypothetical protein